MKINFNPEYGFDIRLDNGEKHTIRWILSGKQQASLSYREEKERGWEEVIFREPVSFVKKKCDISLGGVYDPGYRYWEEGNEPSRSNMIEQDEEFKVIFEDPTPVLYNGDETIPFEIFVDGNRKITHMSINYYHQSKDGMLNVGKLLEMLKDVNPDIPLYVSTTADCGYINCGGYVDDIFIDDNSVTFYSEE